MKEKPIKTKKKLWVIGTIGLAIWMGIFTTDYLKTIAKNNPIYCIPVSKHKDGGSVDYLGVFYKVNRSEVDFDKAIVRDKDGFEYTISPWFF